MRLLALDQKTPAGTAFPVTAPSEEAFRRHVLAGTCPYCGLGPYVVLAIHTQRAHAVDRFELRDRAGLTFYTSITPSDFHARRSEKARKDYEEGKTLRPEHVQAGRNKPRPRMSTAGRRAQQRKSRGATPQVNAEAHAKAGATNSVRRRAEAAGRDARILTMLRDETELTYAAIAAAIGLHPRTIRAVARRHGHQEDGRARYWNTKRGIFSPTLQAGQATRRRRITEQNIRLRKDYAAGVPIADLATTLGVSTKGMVARLRRLGCDVPDGRSTKPTPTRTFTCPECGGTATRSESALRSNAKAAPPGWLGPYCSRSCGAKARRLGSAAR